MDNLIEKYPQSSCDCNECLTTVKKGSIETTGYAGNLGVESCNVSHLYACENYNMFKSGIEPELKKDYYPLNLDALTSNYDKTYIETKPGQTLSYGSLPVFTTNDPRLLSVPLDQVLALDSPPINGAVRLNEVYTKPELVNYGKRGYKNYHDIKAGQILYYIDESIEDSLFEPVFENNAYVDSYVYVDPMGSVKPQYPREPVINTNVMITENDPNHGQLTWMRDSLEYREDLMAAQMSKMNQQKYSARWNKSQMLT